MKESFWAVLVVTLGVIAITFVFIFQSSTNLSEHNYNLLREVAEAAMYDSFDIASYKQDLTIRIDREKFVESFIRRFAQSASLSSQYRVEIVDINEEPPKISIRVSSIQNANLIEQMEFDIVNTLDAILETPY